MEKRGVHTSTLAGSLKNLQKSRRSQDQKSKIFSARPKMAQGAIEFVIIFGALLTFFIIFFTVIQNNVASKNQDKERVIAQSVVLDVQDEINLAAESPEGYIREFSIPPNILGKEYAINISGNRVYFSMEGYSTSYKVSNVIGIVNKGDNIIRKDNGEVRLN